MKRKPSHNNEYRGIFYATVVVFGFFLVVALVLGGLFLFHVNKDFYSAFRLRLSSGFYLSAIGVLVGSSLLYTPFSYGISYYFMVGNGRFRDLFFLFRRPLLMLKAMAVSAVRKLLSYLERLVLLLAAAVTEVALFFLFLLYKGENLFSLQGNLFRQAADFMMRSPPLIVLSVLLWSGVFFGMLIIILRYILCKYVLLLYPDASVMQAVRVGRDAIRGHLLRTLLFYLRYGAYCFVTALSFGLSSRMVRPEKHQRFSVYARTLAEEGWHTYCRRRSRR